MGPRKSSGALLAIPAGYKPVPIHPVEAETPLRLCLLARTSPEAGGPFVLLRTTLDAQVFLGCVVDGGREESRGCREWVEIWVQDVEALAGSPAAEREGLTNHYLDERWKEQARMLRELGPADSLAAVWESRHPLPMFLDWDSVSAVRLADPHSGSPWELCQDDARLTGAGLPAYHTSLARYWYHPGVGAGKGRFVPVVSGAPQSAATMPMSTAVGERRYAPLNAQAGLMMARSFYPLSYEEYVDLLGGKAWGGVTVGKQGVDLGLVYQNLAEAGQWERSGEYLFLGPGGLGGRFVETFHLKLNLLRQVVGLVHAAVDAQKLPFLNLSGESFRVRLSAPAAGLPCFWTAQCGLVKPGQARALSLAGAEKRYFVRLGPAAPPIYQAGGLEGRIEGVGQVRIREVPVAGREGTVVEGTLSVGEVLDVSRNDLLWIKWPLGGGSIPLCGYFELEGGLGARDLRFRTWPRGMGPEEERALREAAESFVRPRCAFTVVPMHSSPCDLHALGALAARTLWVNERNGFAKVMHALFELAAEVEVGYSSDVSLEERLRGLFQGKSRWQNDLGPHQLSWSPLEPGQGRQWLPEELWLEVMGMVLRMFTGQGRDSQCRDPGDVPANDLAAVFEPTLAALERLLVRSRSLVVIDWNTNREIASVIDEILTGPAS